MSGAATMGDYRETARTARDYVLSKGMDPVSAWKEAATKTIGSPAMAKRAPPRATFVALCEAGLVKGVPPGEYADKLGDHKAYAVRMVELLRDDPFAVDEPDWLFTDATGGKKLQDEGQTDVVLGLWLHKLIVDMAVKEA